jgi:hypothetical protein
VPRLVLITLLFFCPAVSRAMAQHGPGTSYYTAEALRADGLRWEGRARRYEQLTQPPAASFYSPRELLVEGRRWQAMAHTYRRASVAPAAITRPGGFDWADAGIGAAGAWAVGACAGALLLGARRARNEKLAGL